MAKGKHKSVGGGFKRVTCVVCGATVTRRKSLAVGERTRDNMRTGLPRRCRDKAACKTYLEEAKNTKEEEAVEES